MDGGRLSECLQIAAEELGFSELTPEQAVVVENFVRGRDVFVSLPTGSGKSLCYGVLPVLFDRLQRSDRRAIVVVVSPLISLMKDQTNSFSARGLSVVFNNIRILRSIPRACVLITSLQTRTIFDMASCQTLFHRRRKYTGRGNETNLCVCVTSLVCVCVTSLVCECVTSLVCVSLALSVCH